ncbi:uncharacterized protein LOC134789915 [Cydia splendana]|uniref:uncharacterized protein LOC134789915 n=1 Tax=Cydia splendana TaxID=1100963 RepID=UPI00300C4368
MNKASKLTKITKNSATQVNEVTNRLLKGLQFKGPDTVQNKYNILEQTIQEAIKEICTETKQERRHKYSDETNRFIELKLQLKHKQNKSRAEKNRLKAINKRIKKLIKRDLEQQKMEEIEKVLTNVCGIKKAERIISIGKEMIPNLTNTTGKIESRKDIVTTATKFFKHLYSTENFDPAIYNRKDCETPKPFLVDEISSAIAKLKSEKAMGPDGINNEILKYSSYELHNAITLVFNKILEEEITPEQWNISKITILHKKGKKDNLDNYRPISISSCMYKLFMTILRRRIERTLEEQQPVEQAGFRSSFSTIDHLHSLNRVGAQI